MTARPYRRPAPTLAAAAGLGLVLTATVGVAKRSNDFCTQVSQAQYTACGHEVLDDYWVARAKCINRSNAAKRADCLDAARVTRNDARDQCREQRDARLEICGDLHEARYDPTFDPADFESDFHALQHANPYFPLTIGYRWDYDGDLETNTIEALDETKLIEGVTCIVLKDKRFENGLLVEETDDWYGQRKNGTIEFCGEQVNNFETFAGDVPARPERLSTDGQWKTGRNGDPPGTFLLGSPMVGDVHRQEFSPGGAEDTVYYLSTSYGYGEDATLDQYVPQALAALFCGAHDCWVTAEKSGIEPGEVTRQYYARGVGFFLGLDAATGQTVQLVGCNFDPRCSMLPVH